MGKKGEIIEYKEDTPLEGYDNILRDIRSLIERAQYRAYKAIDNLRVQTYWQIGEKIVRGKMENKERADYGENVIKKLAVDLDMRKSVLYDILQFYNTYPIFHALRGNLSWTHYRSLMRIDRKEERDFYERLTLQNSWSTRELERQIKDNTYKKIIEKGKMIVPAPQLLEPITPEEAFKDTYSFEFLTMGGDYKEAELEKALVTHIEQLLLEFGTDFSLAGRQKLVVIDGEYHSVDLEFYHRGIPCIVLVDLKIGKFKAGYVGQMNKYLNFYRENRKYEWEKDPVGLIICEHKGREEVRYALGGIERKIFVAEYRVRLPSEEQIKERLKTIKSNEEEVME